MAFVYSDACGVSDKIQFGIGILIEGYGAFQIKRSIYNNYLTKVFSSRSDPTHINYQELLAFLLSVWLLVTKFRKFSHKKWVQFRIDNQTVAFNSAKHRFKNNPTANSLLLQAGDLLKHNLIYSSFKWIPTHEMQLCCADLLSRKKMTYIRFKDHVYTVTRLTSTVFSYFIKMLGDPT